MRIKTFKKQVERIKNEINLLIIISSLCAKTGECWATNKELADLFNCNEVSISRKINNLIKCGYLFARYINKDLKTQRFLTLSENVKPDLNKNVKQEINKNVKQCNIKEINNITEKQELVFNEIWEMYPALRRTCKGGKQAIFKKYCNVLKEKKVTEDDLLFAVKTYLKEKSQDDCKYVCGIEKWFNQEYYVGLLAQKNTATANTSYDFEKDNIPTNFKDDSNCYVCWFDLRTRYSR